jgi:nucleotide-binding universal stress UspA family protein
MTMAHLQHLLTATDLSGSSLHALDRGLMLAAQNGARHSVLHALGLEGLGGFREWLGERNPDVTERLTQDAQTRLKELLDEAVQRTGTGWPSECLVDPGFPGQAIPERVAASGVDLVLVGAHGAGFWQRVLLGSTASKLLRKSTVPVLVVKQPPRHAYRRALVALDFSPCGLRAIQLARELAPDAHLLLLHVFEVPFEGKMQFAGVSDEVIHQYRIEARERAIQQLRQLTLQAGLLPLDHTAVVVGGDAVRELIIHEERHRCELVVMGKHGTHVTEELLLGSVTKRVLAESQSDVLVVVDAEAHPLVQA